MEENYQFINPKVIILSPSEIINNYQKINNLLTGKTEACFVPSGFSLILVDPETDYEEVITGDSYVIIHKLNPEEYVVSVTNKNGIETMFKKL